MICGSVVGLVGNGRQSSTTITATADNMSELTDDGIGPMKKINCDEREFATLSGRTCYTMVHRTVANNNSHSTHRVAVVVVHVVEL